MWWDVYVFGSILRYRSAWFQIRESLFYPEFPGVCKTRNGLLFAERASVKCGPDSDRGTNGIRYKHPSAILCQYLVQYFALVYSGAMLHSGEMMHSGAMLHYGAMLHFDAMLHSGAMLQSGGMLQSSAMLQYSAILHSGTLVQCFILMLWGSIMVQCSTLGLHSSVGSTLVQNPEYSIIELLKSLRKTRRSEKGQNSP